MTADAVGGVWQYCVDLARALAGKGTEILLATLGPGPSVQQRSQIQNVQGVHLAEGNYALEWMEAPWEDVDRSGDWLLELQAKFEADVIHLNGYSHAALPWNRPVLVIAHSCVFSWWRAVHGCAPGPQWNEYRRRVAAGLEAADAVVAPTASMAAALQREYGVSREKAAIIHNFSSVASVSGCDKQPFCLAAGRLWDPAKNLRLLMDLAPRTEWPIRVAGSRQDPNGPSLTATAAQDVELLGNLSHLEFLQELHRAALFVHPALYEPFGLSVLEAALSKCCLVLSDIPSLRELWDGAALFVNPRDDQAWTAEVNRLSRDSSERQLFASHAFSRAAQYNAEIAVDQYTELYTKLVNARNAKGAAA